MWSWGFAQKIIMMELSKSGDHKWVVAVYMIVVNLKVGDPAEH